MQPLRRLIRRIARCQCGCPAAEPPDTGPAAGQNAAEKELDKRFELLQFSYREVLDATKHQDDKINRLLTTVAFLTAASLALAGLLGGKSVTAVYLVDHSLRLPLAVIALAGFLGGITVAVIMLISSLTTPLVFPGGSKPILPEIPYVTAKFGQIYFYEISKTAPPEWYAKWADDISVPSLKRERNASLVRETHNLAVRTDFKYQRSNEAVAVLSFAMLSFVVSALLILIASQRPSSLPVDLNWTARSILAAIFFLYCWLQLISTQRSTPPTVFDKAYPARLPELRPGLCRIAYPLLAAAVLPQLLVLPSEPAWLRVLLSCALPLAAWLAFAEALPWPSAEGERRQREISARFLGEHAADLPPPSLTDDEIAARERPLRRTAGLAAPIAGAYIGIGLWATLVPSQREAVGLAGAYAAGVVLLVSALWQVARKPSEQAKRFRNRAERPPEPGAS